jgi:hypothetical protein
MTKLLKILGLTAEKDGGSARKFSAFYSVVLMAGFITIKKSDATNALNMLIAWLIFAGVCLGMVTIQQIVDFKNGAKTDISNREPEAQENINAEEPK